MAIDFQFANAADEAVAIREMASYVEGIVVQQAGVAQAGTVSPQIAQMFAHINAELGKFLFKLVSFSKSER